MNYLLAPHVFLCRTSDHVVLLDLRRDRYLALDENDACQLGALVAGWPHGSKPDAAQADSHAAELARTMLEQGLLTTEAIGKLAAPIQLPTPTESLAHSYFTEKPQISMKQRAAFAHACAAAAFALQFRPLEQVVRMVRESRPPRSNGPARFDSPTARQLVAVFEGLRPFTFAGVKSCMFDSLALIKFLAHYDLHPAWVFGVCTSPFAAHCWVQEGQCILNDVPDRVSTFTPIMSV